MNNIKNTEFKYPDDFRPLVISFAFEENKNKKDLSFLNLQDFVHVTKYKDVILKILPFCNGLRTQEEIFKLIDGVDADLYHKILDVLHKNEIIVDSREFYTVFHKYSAFPLETSYDVPIERITKTRTAVRKFKKGMNKYQLPEYKKGGLFKLLEKRRSDRSFLSGSITSQELSGLLTSIYSVGDMYSCPSAGGFFPLSLRVLVLKKIGDLEPGLYDYDHSKNILLADKNKEVVSLQLVSMLVNSPHIIEDASVCICVVGDFKSPSIKYSNRAYRHVMLEAGHAAQNAYLYGTENNIGVVELGGFNDVELARLLKLNYPSEAVTTVIVAGKKEEKQKLTDSYNKNSEYKLRKTFVGEGKPIIGTASYVAHHDTYTMPYYVASAKFYPKNDRSKEVHSSYGTGTTLEEARFKALMEGVERYACGCVRVDRKCKKEELKGSFFDINQLGEQKKEYKKNVKLPIQERKDKTISWVEGKELVSNKKIYLPADQVFFPIDKKELGYSQTYRTSSNGVAAHFSHKKAIKNAIFEIIERDAFSVFWYTKRVCDLVPVSKLSLEIQSRVNAYKKINRKVFFLDMTLDTYPVIGCLIKGEEYPCVSFGCASNENLEKAVVKAMNEAEFLYHGWKSSEKKEIDYSKVKSTTDHGDFYAAHKLNEFSELDWILSGKESENITHKKISYRDAIKKVDPIVINLLDDTESGVKVVRAMSKKFIPMNFGYGSEHYRHERVNQLNLEWGWDYPALPHLLA